MNKQTIKDTIDKIESLLIVLKQELNVEDSEYYEEYIPFTGDIDDDVEYYEPEE